MLGRRAGRGKVAFGQSNMARKPLKYSKVPTIQHFIFVMSISSSSQCLPALACIKRFPSGRGEGRGHKGHILDLRWQIPGVHISKATVPLLCKSYAAECNGWVRGHFLRWCWLGLSSWRLRSPATLKGRPTGALLAPYCTNGTANLSLDCWRLISRLQMSDHNRSLFSLIAFLDELRGVSGVSAYLLSRPTVLNQFAVELTGSLAKELMS